MLAPSSCLSPLPATTAPSCFLPVERVQPWRKGSQPLIIRVSPSRRIMLGLLPIVLGADDTCSVPRVAIADVNGVAAALAHLLVSAAHRTLVADVVERRALG